MTLHRWRRQHGPDIVAEVVPVADDLDQWTVSVWLVQDPSATVSASRKIPVLSSALIAADHLVRTTFDHTCDPERCGDWMFWPQ